MIAHGQIERKTGMIVICIQYGWWKILIIFNCWASHHWIFVTLILSHDLNSLRNDMDLTTFWISIYFIPAQSNGNRSKMARKEKYFQKISVFLKFKSRKSLKFFLENRNLQPQSFKIYHSVTLLIEDLPDSYFSRKNANKLRIFSLIYCEKWCNFAYLIDSCGEIIQWIFFFYYWK